MASEEVILLSHMSTDGSVQSGIANPGADGGAPEQRMELQCKLVTGGTFFVPFKPQDRIYDIKKNLAVMDSGMVPFFMLFVLENQDHPVEDYLTAKQARLRDGMRVQVIIKSGEIGSLEAVNEILDVNLKVNKAVRQIEESQIEIDERLGDLRAALAGFLNASEKLVHPADMDEVERLFTSMDFLDLETKRKEVLEHCNKIRDAENQRKLSKEVLETLNGQLEGMAEKAEAFVEHNEKLLADIKHRDKDIRQQWKDVSTKITNMADEDDDEDPSVLDELMAEQQRLKKLMRQSKAKAKVQQERFEQIRSTLQVFSPIPRGFRSSTVLTEKKPTMWLAKQFPKEKKFSLIFRASRDGYTARAFHKNCDNKGPTVTIIEATDGYKFGGYASISWESQGAAIHNAPDCWIFSLSGHDGSPKKSMARSGKEGSNARDLYFIASRGPYWGGGADITIYDNCNVDKASYTNVGNSYAKCTPTGWMASTYNFMVKDYEVYQVV